MTSHFRSPLCHELDVKRLLDIPGYTSWKEMHRRCTVPGRKEFKNYGGRGITVCDRWQSFETFYRDMGPRPSADHSIDRIDVNGNYEPGNCRWATRRVQDGNRRNNRYVVYGGERICLREAIRRAGDVVTVSCALRRIDGFGWSIERAIETPPDPAKRGFTASKRQSGEGRYPSPFHRAAPEHHARVYSGRPGNAAA